MDSTQPRLDFESKEDVDSLHFPVHKARSASKILLFMSIFLREFSVNFMKLFRKNKKRKTLTMQLALSSNDIKIRCVWKATFEATQRIYQSHNK